MDSVGLLRRIIILIITLIILVVFLLIFQFTDVAFRVWDRLQQTPKGFLLIYGVGVCVIALLGVGLVYKIWTLGRSQSASKAAQSNKPPVTLETLQARQAAAQAQGLNTAEIEEEIAAIGRDNDSQSLEVAFFGQISTGKSSLIQTLLPNARIDTSIIGGSTAKIERYHFDGAQGLSLTLLDMPGTHQAQALDSSNADIMTAVRRVHIVVYVIDQDLTASDQAAIEQLHQFDKPMIVALNKANLYQDEAIKQLRTHIASLIPSDARLVVVASAHPEKVRIVNATGEAVWQERLRSGNIAALLDVLADFANERGMLLSKHKQALLALADETLSLRLATYRRERGEAMISAYARKAMLGGVAAVGPGTDVLIQGYLGLDMVKALTKLYEVPVKQVDLEHLIESASSKVRTHLTVILALAGNVFKAFPGVGTVLGGASHAIAYGLIFESLGKALLQTLERGDVHSFSTQSVIQNLEEQLQHDLDNRAQNLVKLALSGRQISKG